MNDCCVGDLFQCELNMASLKESAAVMQSVIEDYSRIINPGSIHVARAITRFQSELAKQAELSKAATTAWIADELPLETAYIRRLVANNKVKGVLREMLAFAKMQEGIMLQARHRMHHTYSSAKLMNQLRIKKVRYVISQS